MTKQNTNLHINHCQSRDSNPCPLASQSGCRPYATETTECIDLSRAFKNKLRNRSKHKQTKPNLRATPIQQSSLFCYILTRMKKLHWTISLIYGSSIHCLSMVKK